MSILTAPARPATRRFRPATKPARRTERQDRPFGEGIFDRRVKHTAEDEAWWVANTPTRHFDYDVLERPAFRLWDLWHATAAPDAAEEHERIGVLAGHNLD